MGTITIFTTAFAEYEDSEGNKENRSKIHQLTRCGNLSPIKLNSIIYLSAKATPWGNNLQVNNPSEFAAAFATLDAGTVESLIMDIPVFLQLKQDTDVTLDGEPVTIPDNEQVVIWPY